MREMPHLYSPKLDWNIQRTKNAQNRRYLILIDPKVGMCGDLIPSSVALSGMSKIKEGIACKSLVYSLLCKI